MVLAVGIWSLDLDDKSALADAYAVECEATAQARPGWVPLGATARIAAWRADNGWTRRLVGAFEGETLVGFASSWTAHDTPDTSWVDVAVLPQHQRRGIGTRLVAAAENASPEGASRFVASAYRATASEIEGLANRSARPLGYAAASTETVVELDLVGADFPAHLPADGYTVSTYLNGVPEQLRAQVGVLKGLVDAEAPNGELGWEPTPVTARDYQDEISLWQAQGRTAVEAIALGPDDDVVAWTCLVVAADPARPAQIEGTMVLAEHRGQRLGRAVKVASLLVARDKTSCRHVRTSSDDQNVWMRAINHELGFVPVECEIILQKQRPAPPD
ncbi:GNAT family N-acetyltransferase [Micromonospora sp. NPDC048999]|uniref:GNAT family N-acetyltransferase n=1 Tax=Micromonospora sp. NPDC048999 TaxID=3155391 RepID=UPI00340E7844